MYTSQFITYMPYTRKFASISNLCKLCLVIIEGTYIAILNIFTLFTNYKRAFEEDGLPYKKRQVTKDCLISFYTNMICLFWEIHFIGRSLTKGSNSISTIFIVHIEQKPTSKGIFIVYKEAFFVSKAASSLYMYKGSTLEITKKY